MKLYYSPGACSMSPHIIAQELGLKLELVKVDMASKKTADGQDFLAINPKGYVPALETDDGAVITEGVAIDLYLSGLKPEQNIVPKLDSKEFLPFLQQMLFVTTELHKGVGSLFAPLPEEAKEMIRKKVATRLAFLASELKSREYVHGSSFTAADAYTFTVLNWTGKVGIDLAPWPELVAYQQRIAQRPSVQAAMEDEGLSKAKAA